MLVFIDISHDCLPRSELRIERDRQNAGCLRPPRSETTTILESDLCLPTALDCQWVEAGTSVRRRFFKKHSGKQSAWPCVEATLLRVQCLTPRRIRAMLQQQMARPRVAGNYRTSCGSKARQGPNTVAITIAFRTSHLVPISDLLAKRRFGSGAEALGASVRPKWSTATLGTEDATGASFTSSEFCGRRSCCAESCCSCCPNRYFK